MKRSEMVKKLYDWMYGKPTDFTPEKLLDLIEKEGMLPPFSVENVKHLPLHDITAKEPEELFTWDKE